jgi:hypothetical protein
MRDQYTAHSSDTHGPEKKEPAPFREAGSYLGDAAMFPLPFSKVISPYRSG